VNGQGRSAPAQFCPSDDNTARWVEWHVNYLWTCSGEREREIESSGLLSSFSSFYLSDWSQFVSFSLLATMFLINLSWELRKSTRAMKTSASKALGTWWLMQVGGVHPNYPVGTKSFRLSCEDCRYKDDWRLRINWLMQVYLENGRQNEVCYLIGPPTGTSS